ncbi:cell wall-binding repeat-containing protein [Candidatus Poriferisodalis sp.]|uniref:cell wall-binding repeat-containing protein n=1 Tax=Candidatus Poriferisodalis sp. TaxID=3101277 RepID=UPI003B02830F
MSSNAPVPAAERGQQDSSPSRGTRPPHSRRFARRLAPLLAAAVIGSMLAVVASASPASAQTEPAPQYVRAEARDASIWLQWLISPTASGYEVGYQTGCSGNWSTRTSASGNGFHLFTGLNNGTCYHVRVRANGGAWATLNVGLTPRSFRPGQPTNVCYTVSGNVVTVSWTRPGGKLTGFETQYQHPSGGWWVNGPRHDYRATSASFTVPQQTIDVGPLITEYNVRVRAVGDEAGDWVAAMPASSCGGGTGGGIGGGGGVPGGGGPGGSGGPGDGGGGSGGGDGPGSDDDGEDRSANPVATGGTVVLVNGWNADDAAVASHLASRLRSGVMAYTSDTEVPDETEEFLNETKPNEVIFVGDTDAVPPALLDRVRSLRSSPTVWRVSGTDRAAIAANAARHLLGRPAAAEPIALVVVNGESPGEIGVAAAVAARMQRSVIVYTAADALPEASAALLNDYDVKRARLIGGPESVGPAVRDAIIAAGVEPGMVTRLAGADLAETAALAARNVLPTPGTGSRDITLVIVNGGCPPDVAIAAGLAADLPHSAVAFTETGSLPAATEQLLRDFKPMRIYLVGGTAVVSEEIHQAIASASPRDVIIRRLTGESRIETSVNTARWIRKGR